MSDFRAISTRNKLTNKNVPFPERILPTNNIANNHIVSNNNTNMIPSNELIANNTNNKKKNLIDNHKNDYQINYQLYSKDNNVIFNDRIASVDTRIENLVFNHSGVNDLKIDSSIDKPGIDCNNFGSQ